MLLTSGLSTRTNFLPPFFLMPWPGRGPRERGREARSFSASKGAKVCWVAMLAGGVVVVFVVIEAKCI